MLLTENFDTLASSGTTTFTNNLTIPNWYSARTGTGTTIVANDGGSSTGNLYSYGVNSNIDRALGALPSSNASVGDLYYGWVLQNTSGGPVTLSLSYTGEQWRNSGAGAQTVSFSYLRSMTAPTGSLLEFQSAGTPLTSLNFTSPITGGGSGRLDGNLAVNQVALSSNLNLSTPLANGEYILLRWADPLQVGASHGLAIDNLTVTVVPEPNTLALLMVSTICMASITRLKAARSRQRAEPLRSGGG